MIQSTVSNVLQHQAKHVKQSIWRKIFTHFFNAHICFASLTTQPKPKRKGRRKNRTGIIRLIWVLNLQAKSTKQKHLHPPQETSLLGSSKHNESHKIHPNTNTSHKTPTHTDLHDSHILGPNLIFYLHVSQEGLEPPSYNRTTWANIKPPLALLKNVICSTCQHLVLTTSSYLKMTIIIFKISIKRKGRVAGRTKLMNWKVVQQTRVKTN